jgi:hypothetical protein
MAGDERIRVCGTCSQNVFQLGAFGEDEAEAFLATQEEESQLFRRSDGTILLLDCPVGFRRRHARRVVSAAMIVTAMIALVAVGISKIIIKVSHAKTTSVETHARVVEPPRKKATVPVADDDDEDPTAHAQRVALQHAAASDDALQFGWGHPPNTGTTVRMPADDEGALVPNRTWISRSRSRSGKYHGAVVQNTYISIARIDALSIQSIATVVYGSYPRFRNCYQAYLSEVGWIGRLGGLPIAFTIASDGSVRDVGFDGFASTGDTPSSITLPAFTVCIKSEFNTLSFPKPSDGKPVRVGYGFLFYED